MSYEAKRKSYEREHIYVVEIDLDTCAHTAGQAPCTASETGDAKCFNTFATCNDLTNYDSNNGGTTRLGTKKTYRFCQARSPHPTAIEAIPSLESANISPSKIDLRGGLGVRSSVSLALRDHPHSDIGVDPYVAERSTDPETTGSYWTKLRARNPNYENRDIRVLSGYLEDDGSYDPVNFITRYYVIDKLNVTGGQVQLTGKDPLKLAMEKKAQAPEPSTGRLLGDITAAATTATLQPIGVGDAEYASTGHVLISSEVMAFTRSGDTLTLTRGQYNTIATDHSDDDTVQECLVYEPQKVDLILTDLLTNYAKIDSAFIPSAAWAAETEDNFPNNLSGIVVKPHDVYRLLKELAEAAPHYLWWDERTQLINLTVIKEPLGEFNVLDMESNFIADSFKTSDRPDLRASTVYVNFGQFDPTKNLNEIANYRQTYVRSDGDSITNYGSNQIKTISTRWIPFLNSDAARRLAALYGRRYADTPRECSFELDVKDGDAWAGQTRAIRHRDIVDALGNPKDTNFQILSAKETRNFQYQALEYTWGPALPEDGEQQPGINLVTIGADALNINLRTEHDNRYGVPDAGTTVIVKIEAGVQIGGEVLAQASIDTGSFPAGVALILDILSGAMVAGLGGKGAFYSASGGAGSTALLLNNDLELRTNLGIIGGGGGGGGGAQDTFIGGAGGGGGAGINGGEPGENVSGRDIPPEPGTTTTGGSGGYIAAEPWRGGDGGDLGQPGQSGQQGDILHPGGAAGAAIDKNGYTLTGTLGDIRGDILT